MIGLPKGRVNLNEWVDEYDSVFKREQNLLKQIIALDDIVLSVIHVGATSVVDAVSRPVIDILVTVPSISSIKQYLKKMTIVGFELVPNKRFKDALYFEKSNGEGIYCTVYVTKENSETARKFINIKKYLSTHGNLLKEMNDLKKKLVKKYKDKEAKYNAKKYSFLKKVAKLAEKEYAIKVQIKKPSFK